MQENGLDLRAIDPRKSEKYSGGENRMELNQLLGIAQQAELGRLITRDWLPDMWHSADIPALVKFANLIGADVADDGQCGGDD
jgi:uncharacterized Fe-S cluster-containing radical SAM superfamily enzyme